MSTFTNTLLKSKAALVTLYNKVTLVNALTMTNTFVTIFISLC